MVWATLLPSKWKVCNKERDVHIDVELLLFFLEMRNSEGFSELKVLSFWLIRNFHYGFSLWGQRGDRNEQSSLGGA